MQTYRLRHRDHTTLFEGDYRTYRECIEDAVTRHIPLDGVSFRYADLSEINLDGAVIREADFSGANLTGANISEATLIQCHFDNTALFNACFAQTDLTGSVFTDTGFGGTDLAGARIDACLFSGTSALSLNFTDCDSMHDTVFQAGAHRCAMTRPPVVVAGAGEPIAVFDHDILLGRKVFRADGAVWQAQPASPVRALTQVPHDLYKALTLLQRVRDQECGAIIVASMKSTKS